MKKTIITTISLLIFFACGESKKNNNKQKTLTKPKKEVTTNSLTSADYNSLLKNYSCKITISQVAKVLDVPETDLSIPDEGYPSKCLFNLKGFGTNVLDGGSRLVWGPIPSSKAQNKKEIESYLKRKKEGLKIMGMDIQLAETGDCYLAYQPAHGRLIIYNDAYDQAFLINYGRRSANTDRTKEQHEELRLKMTNLANHLLKKHRK